MQHHESHDRGADNASGVARLVFFGFVAVAGFYLITEHRAHLYGLLPFLLLAACPLMHLFHHRGHGSHGGRDEASPSDGRADQENPPAQRRDRR